MQHVKNKDSIDWCQYYMHQLLVEYLIDSRKFKYCNELATSECYLLRHLYQHAASGHVNTIKKSMGL